MAEEDAAIRRLRRLMGNQAFEAEVAKGKAIQEQEAAERAACDEIEPTDHKENIISSATKTNTATSTAENVAPRTPTPPPARSERKQHRKKPKRTPCSDTEYETDSDAENWDHNQEAGPEMAFCPIFAVNKFPYKYLSSDKDFMERVADSRFNSGQFFSRRWSIFYLKPPSLLSGNPIFFVPEKQVKALFEEVSSSVGTEIGFPAGRLATGFRIEFLPTEPRPRYLGISNSREQFDNMVMHRVPTSDNDINGSWSEAKHDDDRAFKVWQAKLEAAISASKQKKARNKANAQHKRIASKQQWCRQVRRAQRYLGLRAPNDKEAKGACTSIQEETAALQAEFGIEDADYPPELDIAKPPQFSFDQDVVFISLDIEAHETMQTMITEIGISTLDTRDLKDVAPGSMAENWRSLIKYRHFRINEFKHHANSRFISGCPERFEKAFGVSEFIPMADIAKVTATTCKPPFPLDAAERAAVATVLIADEPANIPEPRKTVLVGHNFDCDVDWLKRHGFEILKLSGLIEVLDTSMIHRALVHEINPTTLANVLNMCSIPGWNLHNAGNDAGYTLQVLLAMAVDHLTNPERRRTEEEHVTRRESAMKLAAEREDTDFQEWLMADRGGSPSRIEVPQL